MIRRFFQPNVYEETTISYPTEAADRKWDHTGLFSFRTSPQTFFPPLVYKANQACLTWGPQRHPAILSSPMLLVIPPPLLLTSMVMSDDNNNNNNNNNINCHLLTTYYMPSTMPTTSHALFLIFRKQRGERSCPKPYVRKEQSQDRNPGLSGTQAQTLHHRTILRGPCEGTALPPLFPGEGMAQWGQICVHGLLALMPGDTTVLFSV